MTKVINLRHEPFDVYIGRGSKWGNPFVVGRDGTREEVIEKFRKEKLPELAPFLHELIDKTLGCFCKPKPCHGDVLVEAANEIVELRRIVADSIGWD